MNAQEIKEVLENGFTDEEGKIIEGYEGLKGRNYDSYSSYSRAVRLLRKAVVKYLGWTEAKASFIDNGYGRHQNELTYCGYSIGEIKITKKRGEYHKGFWYNGHYDWPIVSVSILIYRLEDNEDPSFEERIEALQEQIRKDREEKETELGFAREAYKAIRAKFPDYDYWELLKLVRVLKDKLYDLNKEEENKKD